MKLKKFVIYFSEESLSTRTAIMTEASREKNKRIPKRRYKSSESLVLFSLLEVILVLNDWR